MPQLLDPNTQPYFITDTATGQRVRVRFEPLTVDDRAELNSAEWNDAVFGAAWLQLLGAENVYKLILADSQERTILGLLQVGEVEELRGRVKNSLLETAPINRYGSSGPRYSAPKRNLFTALRVLRHLHPRHHGMR